MSGKYDNIDLPPPHHDGIEEHDNHLPNWWLATLFGAMIFAMFYWFYYQTFAVGPSTREALASEEARLHALRGEPVVVSDDALLTRSKDAAAVGRGKEVFASNCVACHNARAEGNVGPNLTDAYWLHGGHPGQIYTTVTKGVVDKGMLSWGPILGDEKVQDVVAFVLTLKNTNVPGKAPQGEKEP